MSEQWSHLRDPGYLPRSPIKGRLEAELQVHVTGRGNPQLRTECVAANGETIGALTTLYNDARDLRRAVEPMAIACEAFLTAHPVTEVVHVRDDPEADR